MTTVAETIELDDTAWAAEREEAAQRFLGLSAEDFIAGYKAGAYDGFEPDGLMAVLGFFPELD